MRVIETIADRAAFAAERRPVLRRDEDTLKRSVRLALGRWGKDGWFDPLVRRVEAMARFTYRQTTGTNTSQALRAALADFRTQVGHTLAQTSRPDLSDPHATSVQVNAIAASLATAAHNLATTAAAHDLTRGRELGKVWLSMDDALVRPAHRVADGQKVPLAQRFTVGGVEMDYPGDVTAPIELWINCRCILGIEFMTIEQAVTAGGEGEAMTITEETMAVEEVPDLSAMQTPDALPWHGVLAPEGVLSGDGRKFADGSLRTRDLPLPLSWQKTNDAGHDGSVVVGRIDNIWRQDGQMRGTGVFLTSSPEADEAVGLLAEGGIRGVSIDADDGTMQMELRDGTPLEEAMDRLAPETDDYVGDGIPLDDIVTVFTDARICGATLCPIPAFQEAFVRLGEAPEGFGPQQEPQTVAASIEFRSISEKPWDGSSSRFTDEQWCASTVLSLEDGCTSKSAHKLPILEPDGALSRAAVHNAAARINQTQGPPAAKAKAKAALRSAYRTLGDDLPDVLKAQEEEVEEFGRGPGWLTNPKETRRLHDYWTVPGHAGYAKIGWGRPGDFNRCRVEVGQEIGENSPAKLRFLNQICAQWHHDALGIWPGRPVSSETVPFNGRSISLVASATSVCPPADWFDDPHLLGPSPLTVTTDGRVFGHLATWGTCHIGFDKVCITPPTSVTDYAYFHTGALLADDGTQVAVGHITMDTGHADTRASGKVASCHYDDTGACAADVCCGEDEFGIWVAGAVRPSMSQEKVAELRSAVLSGDWREFGGHLELVAALAVNVGGFPIPRTALAASAGRQTSLVAAGIVTRVSAPEQGANLTKIVLDALDEYEARKHRRGAMAALALKTRRARMAALAGRR